MAELVFANSSVKNKIKRSSNDNKVRDQSIETGPPPTTKELSINLTWKPRKLEELRNDSYKFYIFDSASKDSKKSIERAKFGSRLEFIQHHDLISTFDYTGSSKSKL